MAYLTICLFFPNRGVSQSTPQPAPPKKTNYNQLIEEFSPDLNVQAKQQKRRLDGFNEHNADALRYNRIRESGETQFNEDLLKWAEEREFLTKKYKNEKALEAKNVNQRYKEQKTHEQAMAADEVAFAKNQKKYIIAREKVKADSVRKFSEEQELKIFETRPRYDDKKRSLYGAKAKYSLSKPGGSSSSSGYSGGGNDDYSAPPPPPPPMDSGNMDYFPPPPPPPPMDDYNVPPPPPSDEYGNPVTDYGMPPPPPPDFGQGGY